MAQADMTAVADWTDRLHDLAAQERVPGAALGVWAGGRESLAAYGVLNAATGVGTTPGSLFQIGSITKVWTATMIMQLIDEGRLSLDATVEEVLPGLRLGREDAAAEIRVRHLLTHTSGIDGDIFTDTGRGADCVELYVGELAQAARVFPPGAAYSYCNSGFVLLGRIIEVLDGREWDASLRERLIGPLDLGQTVTLPEEAILHRAATGHREHPRQDDPVSVWGLPRSIGPAGLITASVHDVLTFARLHLDAGVTADGTRLLTQASVSAMQQAQLEIPGVGGRADAIGLPWRLSRWDGRRIIGHDGGTIGQSAFLRIDPEARVAACLLTNSPEAQGLYQQLFSEVFSASAGIAVPASPEPAAGPAELDLQRHAGRYERTSRRYDVSVRNGRLHVSSAMTDDRAAFSDEGPQEFDLYPAGPADGADPAGSAGDAFVCRLYDHQPWTPVTFGRLSDETPYVYLGGRITPRVA
jgi:CubicO group peptidase (beta-lactamase class C family)